MLSLGETTEAVVVWHLCSLEKLLNMPCSFLDCCPFPGFRILSGILGSVAGPRCREDIRLTRIEEEKIFNENLNGHKQIRLPT
jgi:hypothetical protein